MGKSSGANCRQVPSSQGSPVWQRCSVTFGPRISPYRWWVFKETMVFFYTFFINLHFLPQNMVFLIMFHHFSSFLPRSFNTFNTAIVFFRNSVNDMVLRGMMILWVFGDSWSYILTWVTAMGGWKWRLHGNATWMMFGKGNYTTITSFQAGEWINDEWSFTNIWCSTDLFVFVLAQ